MQSAVMGKYNIRCIAATADVCGEGAVWHPAHNAVYWTDINRGLLHRHRIATPGEFDMWQFEQPVTALTLTSDPKKLLVVLGGSFLLWDPDDDLRDKILYTLPQWPEMRCNDARVDPAGTLWFGTMQNNVASNGSTMPVTNHIGSLLSFHRDGEARVWRDGFAIQNTIAWTPSSNKMLYGDTLLNEIYACDYDDASQAIANERIFTRGFERGLPDGSAMDEEGYLWNCRYGGGCIVRFAPDGSVNRVIETPVPNPTTCAFGGVDLKTLYFTSAGEGVQAAGPNDGGLFCFETDVRGLPATSFRLKF
jgi:sugar lactone lactonase YvrE